MKKLISLLLACTLLLSATAFAAGFQLPTIALPEDSTVFSPSFGAQALARCLVSPSMVAMFGVRPVQQAHFEKDAADAAHSSAYMVRQGSVTYKGEVRPLMVIVIRATATAGEWASNFDCVPSRSNDAQYAENFYAAAQDIYEGSKAVLDAVENPAIVVTGYSRGAACANLLGMMLNETYGVQNVFVYTAATPTTVRGDAASIACPNIFNVINPADLITALPPTAWGYGRLGTDIVLPADEELTAKVQDTMAALVKIAPDIESYYTLRYNLMGPGQGEYGLTVYDLMLQLSKLLSGAADTATAANALALLSPQSDLAPLANAFTSGDADANPLAQHLPGAYLTLFNQWQTQQLP